MKPIVLTDEMKKEMIEEFSKSLDKTKLIDGEMNFKRTFNYKEHERARLVFQPDAYIKMLSLVQNFTTEVGWHGLVRRIDDNAFEIYDIIVYDQEVDGSNVNTVQDKYEKWLMEIPDDTAKDLRFHGHSHVNFGVTPSGVDRSHWEQLMRSVRKDGFYVFMIINKSLETTVVIYDAAMNVQYDTKDIDIELSTGVNLTDFLTGAKAKVQKKKTGKGGKTWKNSNTGYSTNSYYPTPYNYYDDDETAMPRNGYYGYGIIPKEDEE